MKLIKKFKSPNFNLRKSKKILFIIIHYTALKNYKYAISHLCNPKKKVSSHFLITQSGNIFKLVDEKKRAWHAGLSYWNKFKDINSLSIGIELDYSFNKENNTFSEKMINSLTLLLKKLKKKYNIKNHNILGHSDISPYRKIDPGINFPWQKIDDTHLYFKSDKNLKKIKLWFKKNNIKSSQEIALFILSFIGYDTIKVKQNNQLLRKLIFAYQSHYLQSNCNGKLDSKTLDFLIYHLYNNLLTIY